jgi:hypothetical protein
VRCVHVRAPERAVAAEVAAAIRADVADASGAIRPVPER